jgi:hypothetical protein
MKMMHNQYTSGCNSVVECLLPKQNVVGSNPITRSIPFVWAHGCLLGLSLRLSPTATHKKKRLLACGRPKIGFLVGEGAAEPYITVHVELS